MKSFTCIVCPRGCRLKIDEKTLETTGNFCPRGQKYAVTEITHPMRSFTSFLRCEDGKILCIKTSGPIPKERIMDICDALRDVHPKSGYKIGDVIVPNILSLNVDIVVTREA